MESVFGLHKFIKRKRERCLAAQQKMYGFINVFIHRIVLLFGRIPDLCSKSAIMNTYENQREISIALLEAIADVCGKEPRFGYIDVVFYGSIENTLSHGFNAELYCIGMEAETNDFKLGLDHPVFKKFVSLRNFMFYHSKTETAWSQIRISYAFGTPTFQFNYDEPSPLWPSRNT